MLERCGVVVQCECGTECCEVESTRLTTTSSGGARTRLVGVGAWMLVPRGVGERYEACAKVTEVPTNQDNW